MSLPPTWVLLILGAGAGYLRLRAAFGPHIAAELTAAGCIVFTLAVAWFRRHPSRPPRHVPPLWTGPASVLLELVIGMGGFVISVFGVAAGTWSFLLPLALCGGLTYHGVTAVIRGITRRRRSPARVDRFR